MKLDFPFLKFVRLSEIKKKFSSVGERDMIFYGLLAVAVLFGVLVFLDGYFFVTTVLQGSAQPSGFPLVHASLSERDIDETVRLLDERAQKFNEMLGIGVEATSTKK